MSDNNNTYSRWYDKDEVVSKCVKTLENLPDSLKRKTATFIMEHVIQKPPYSDMLPDEVFNLATGDDRKRRWYDFDEVVRIFVELLRHSSDETKREIAILAISFIEDMMINKDKSVEIIESEESKEFWFIKDQNLH